MSGGRDKNYPVTSGAMNRLMNKIKRTVSESVSKLNENSFLSFTYADVA